MSKTPRTDELRNRASKGNLDESDLFDAAEQLETELASVQMELGATKGELSEAKRCSYAKGMRDADLKRIQELVIELQESQAREAQLREALESIGEYWNHAPESAVDAIETAEGLAADALSQPAPPVVPMADVKPLLEALGAASNRLLHHAPLDVVNDVIEVALTTFTSKYP